MNLTAHVSSRRNGVEIALFNKVHNRTLSVLHGNGKTVTDALCDALNRSTAFYVDEDVEIALCVAALRDRPVELIVKGGTIHAN
ncbi:hypothetical protein H8Z72_23415 (plasmid) [Xanthomonas citri pv. citri]|uniref:hypothetical protein n=1 Tax=Xanthomonas citri TaxID=346 RepID=UPI0019335835|nr:hypothetical protein [Xanthomonas citri]QRD62736.1 hypothetical protein H8Z74_22770 [Xanthomonas citri pv. citri]QRD67063.1 hypothetical protein H8Z73_22855 [Xanthomonas citri pv. citri]QRD71684.1 hypothetical protein H8Z72_23415 [Xanthomonas citri pv. citri]